MNIGWKDTNVVILSIKKQENNYEKEDDTDNLSETQEMADQPEDDIQSSAKITADYVTLEYAGRNISMLIDAADNNLDLQSYPNILNILLCGSWKLGEDTDAAGMLKEFSELFHARTKDVTHYQGVFDMIAMKIDKAGNTVSRDIFNNAREFKCFLMAITYNIILLFLEVGILIKKCKYTGIKKVKFFLGGNGANFLKWILNDKGNQTITQKNASENMILQMESNIIDYIKKAAGLGEEVELSIELIDNVDHQLVQGCKTKMLNKDVKMPEFEYNVLADTLSSEQCEEFVRIMNELCVDVFRDFPDLEHKVVENLTQPANDISAIDIIENERKEICRQVIDEINKITSSS